METNGQKAAKGNQTMCPLNSRWALCTLKLTDHRLYCFVLCEISIDIPIALCYCFYKSYFQTIVGTDIADLLLEDHVPNTSDYGDSESKAESERESTQSPATQENSALQMTTTSDRVLVNRSMDLNEKTDRFRNLLLYGRKKVYNSFVLNGYFLVHLKSKKLF